MEPGINLIGYARTESGLGESCRLAANAITTTNVPFGIIDYQKNPSRKNDFSWLHKEIKKPIYQTNIFHINAYELFMGYKSRKLPQQYFRNHYNIGFWHWELPEFPDEWNSSFQLVDEIWVPSSFIYESISKKSPVPVLRMPHGIKVNISNSFNRESWGLPHNQFLFLCMFDTLSFQERKNPQAVIEAFKSAFSGESSPVGLVIKVNSSCYVSNELNDLKMRINGFSNIYLIDTVLTRDEVNCLINSIDCYISLHRSEGFGLPLAEAMYLGKPVIATNWSGNIDFMNSTNSCPVNYRLINIGDDYGPYKAYQKWAEPDVEHAANYMKKIVKDEEWRKKLSSMGKESIRFHFSPGKIGNMYKKRLQYLGLL